MKRPCPYHLVAGIRVLCEVFSVLVKVGTIYGVHQGVLKSDCFAEPSQLLPAIMQSIIMSFISENRPTWLKFQSVGTRTCRTVWAMPPHPPTRVLPWNTHLLYVDKVTLWPSSRICISKRNLAKTSKRPVKWAQDKTVFKTLFHHLAMVQLWPFFSP